MVVCLQEASHDQTVHLSKVHMLHHRDFHVEGKHLAPRHIIHYKKNYIHKSHYFMRTIR